MRPGAVAVAQLAALPTLAIDDPSAYDRLKDRIRVLVAVAVPAGRTVVVSKGDDELLALHDRRGEHFPQDEAGRFTSAHPADGAEAVAALRALVDRGARHLLVPATSFWWFAHYGELTAVLAASASLVALDAQTAAVLDLRPDPPAITPAPLRSLLDALLEPGVPVAVLGGDPPDLGRPVGDRARYAVVVAPATVPRAASRGALVTAQRHVGELRDRAPA